MLLLKRSPEKSNCSIAVLNLPHQELQNLTTCTIYSAIITAFFTGLIFPILADNFISASSDFRDIAKSLSLKIDILPSQCVIKIKLNSRRNVFQCLWRIRIPSLLPNSNNILVHNRDPYCKFRQAFENFTILTSIRTLHSDNHDRKICMAHWLFLTVFSATA